MPMWRGPAAAAAGQDGHVCERPRRLCRARDSEGDLDRRADEPLVRRDPGGPALPPPAAGALARRAPRRAARPRAGSHPRRQAPDADPASGSEVATHDPDANLFTLGAFSANPAPCGNSNGLVRQYLPNGADLCVYPAADPAAIGTRLNSRPGKTLGWQTPAAIFSTCMTSAPPRAATACSVAGRPTEAIVPAGT